MKNNKIIDIDKELSEEDFEIMKSYIYNILDYIEVEFLKDRQYKTAAINEDTHKNGFNIFLKLYDSGTRIIKYKYKCYLINFIFVDELNKESIILEKLNDVFFLHV